MNVTELAKSLGATVVCGDVERTVSGCYIGDLLSLAMSRVQKDYVWITIQTNINVAAVATLTEAGCVLLCDGCSPDENMAKKADAEGIAILRSGLSAYELAKKLSELGI